VQALSYLYKLHVSHPLSLTSPEKLDINVGLQGIAENTEAPCETAIYLESRYASASDIEAAKSTCLYRGCTQCGTEQDFDQAHALALKSSPTSLLGKFRLAIHVERGQGCERDTTKARELLEYVAENNAEDDFMRLGAYFNLGCMANNGEFGEEGKSKLAIQYWQKGAATGCVMCLSKLGAVCMRNAKIREAIEFFEACVPHPYCPHSAVFNLGQILLVFGLNVLRGKALIIRAASQGNQGAINFIKIQGHIF
jgi:TPR repeat protein